MHLDTNGFLTGGSRIGRYVVLEPRGQGFTQYYLGRDPLLERRVLIQFNALLEANESLDEALTQIAKMMAHLQHPAILPIYDIGKLRSGKEGWLLYIVSEWTESSLRDEMAKRDYSRVANVMARISEAADYMHRRGYVHRNIDPAIIRIGADGEPKLSGFNVVATSTEASRGPFRGATPYVAPEQILGHVSDIGPQSDIWAIGATIYHAITGRLPFAGDARTIAQEISEAEPPRPEELQSDIPSDLAETCLRCLRKRPQDRYSTAAQLARELRQISDHLSTQVKQRVFISHSSRDRPFVEREIVAYLERCGVSTWYSEAEIQSASEWERSIVNGLNSCQWFLITLSSESANSEWVKDELFWAIENRVGKIIPVVIGECVPADLHIRLARIEYIDARSEQNWQQRMVSVIQSQSD